MNRLLNNDKKKGAQFFEPSLISIFCFSKGFLGKVKNFLKSLPCSKIETLKCGSNVLDKPVIQSIHDCVEQLKVCMIIII